MELYFVRHGETNWNLEHRYYGITDIELNNAGICQAKEVGILLKDIQFDKVYTSPLIRTIETCNYILEVNKATPQNIEKNIDIKLMEQNLGLFEGYTYQELQLKFPQELKQWNHDYRSAPHGGENFEELYSRVIQFCKNELKLNNIEFTENKTITCSKELEKKRILVVSHMSVLRCIMMILLKMGFSSIWNFTFEQGAYSRIDVEDGYAIVKKINQR